MPVVDRLLPPVVAAVTHAGEMLIQESRRPNGPRGTGDKAGIDVEIETYLQKALNAVMPCRLEGEELGVLKGDGSDFYWLVDPHDGTSAWLKGYRGSAVSVALLHAGKPVLGVVCSPMSPDRGWDLIAWAEGLPHLLRNGVEVRVDLSQMDLQAGGVPDGIVFSESRVRGGAHGIGHVRCPRALREPAEHSLPVGTGSCGRRCGRGLLQRP